MCGFCINHVEAMTPPVCATVFTEYKDVEPHNIYYLAAGSPFLEVHASK